MGTLFGWCVYIYFVLLWMGVFWALPGWLGRRAHVLSVDLVQEHCCWRRSCVLREKASSLQRKLFANPAIETNAITRL